MQIRFLLAAVLVSTLFASGGRAGADARNERVDGLFVRVEGRTREASSFGPSDSRADSLDLQFGRDTFSAFGVNGTFEQKGRRIHFQVDPARLRAYERSWASSFERHLVREGRTPESVLCEMKRGSLKGRSQRGMFKFRSSYKVRCEASGDFGEASATGRVRFRGEGPLVLVLSPGPGLAGGTSGGTSGGTAGGTFTAVTVVP